MSVVFGWGVLVYLFVLHSVDTIKDLIMECNVFLTLGLETLESSATSRV